MSEFYSTLHIIHYQDLAIHKRTILFIEKEIRTECKITHPKILSRYFVFKRRKTL